jgi:tRNA threonylcarbamoyladenosine biosynthesis protein TsaB
MKVLSLETSAKQFSLAISDGGKVLKSCKMVLDKVLSDSIVPAIEKILKDSKLPLAQIDALVVGLGPGSFTSLRVGLSTVKGLAFAADKPVIGIPSLDAVALNVGETPSQICVIADAKRNMVYAALYENKKGSLKRKSEYLLTPLTDLLGRIEADTVFVGDAVKLYQPQLEAYFSNKNKLKIDFAPESQAHPDAKGLIVLAQDDLKKKKFANIDKLVPLYLYPEDCQVQK